MNYYKSGQFNVICDICGKKIKAGDSKHRWDGFIVHEGCFEYRHPQDFVKAKTDKISVPFSRPRPADIFIPVPYPDPEPYCTIIGQQAISSWGIPGCMTPNKNTVLL